MVQMICDSEVMMPMTMCRLMEATRLTCLLLNLLGTTCNMLSKYEPELVSGMKNRKRLR